MHDGSVSRLCVPVRNSKREIVQHSDLTKTAEKLDRVAQEI